MIAINRLHDNLSLVDIWEARRRIAPIINETPLVKSPYLEERAKSSVYLKLENLQEIGAFKVRGAANKILSLSKREQQLGVATFSTGNHGLAVAYVAQQLGIKAVIYISRRVPKAKIEALSRFNAQIEIVGDSQDEAGEHCLQLVEKHGLTLIKPFDDPYIIAGQGTIGLELIEMLPQLDAVIIPLSGGGLLAGIALALKEINPSIRVIGVSMAKAAVMDASLKAGKPVELPEEETLADSLQGGIGLDNQFTYPLVQKYIDELHLVSEESIAKGMAFMLEKHRQVIEGAAATGIGLLVENQLTKLGRHVVSIVTGNNVGLPLLIEAIRPYIYR